VVPRACRPQVVRNWALSKLLIEALEDMKLSWPEADFELAEQKARLIG
jgi:hypothetical protein